MGCTGSEQSKPNEMLNKIKDRVKEQPGIGRDTKLPHARPDRPPRRHRRLLLLFCWVLPASLASRLRGVALQAADPLTARLDAGCPAETPGWAQRSPAASIAAVG